MMDYILATNPQYMINGRFYTFNDMKKELKRLEKEGDINNYEYKELKYIHDLVDKKKIQNIILSLDGGKRLSLT
ncbi:hypothetical protein H477_4238 [[Clostridium] sordellii ATCC 9714]|nr:hypothetical protein H477_4238 [[Clostridium] sordellii ATCC 9714] [Paeniclostridium sordellii ATCC 9714]